MANRKETPPTLKDTETTVFDELISRIEDIDNTYRSVAEKMGQLYMRADEHHLTDITSQLDKPMRNASDNEQAFAALLDEMRMLRNRR
jgi:septation ring formation regulator EzrA